jgi:hypothetical protein
MAGPYGTQQLGSVTRIYKNTNDLVIAIDDVSIVGDTRKVGDGKFHRSGKRTYRRFLFNLETGNRTITAIQMIGDYSSITEDAGNFNSATWTDSTGDANDIVVSFADLKQLGDSV